MWVNQRGVAKTQIAGLHPMISDTEDLGWDPKMYISNKFPGDAHADLVPDHPSLNPAHYLHLHDLWSMPPPPHSKKSP